MVVQSEQSRRPLHRLLCPAQKFMQDISHTFIYMPTVSPISWIHNQGTANTSSLAFVMLSTVVAYFGKLGRGLSKSDVRPRSMSLNPFLTVAIGREGHGTLHPSDVRFRCAISIPKARIKSSIHIAFFGLSEIHGQASFHTQSKQYSE